MRHRTEHFLSTNLIRQEKKVVVPFTRTTLSETADCNLFIAILAKMLTYAILHILHLPLKEM